MAKRGQAISIDVLVVVSIFFVFVILLTTLIINQKKVQSELEIDAISQNVYSGLERDGVISQQNLIYEKYRELAQGDLEDSRVCIVLKDGQDIQNITFKNGNSSFGVGDSNIKINGLKCDTN